MADITKYEKSQIDEANKTGVTPVVFVHGLWLLPSSWDKWRTVFEAAGFTHNELALSFFGEPQPTLRNPSMTGLPAKSRQAHWYFDGWATTRCQLAAAGVRSERIHIAELCSASHAEHLCSYRRDGKAAGRMAAVVRCATPRPSPRSPGDLRAR